jgi:hypothetical protein
MPVGTSGTQNVILVDLEQRNITNVVHLERLKLDGIDAERSNTSAHDADQPPSTRSSLHQLILGRTHLKMHQVGGQWLVDDIDAEGLSFR